MAPRLFALIIGIDMYKSGDIWNLESSVHDAKRISRWLVKNFSVPRQQISLLLNNKATKQNIEDAFTSHLINNDNIQTGDAILIYFAGHGSTMRAPPAWFQAGSGPGNVHMICPYDHDTKDANGQRITGISDRSMEALIRDLACAKGNNITLVLDCCFSPVQSRSNVRDRSFTRWTATTKAKREDLFAGLWPSAGTEPYANMSGFYNASSTHTTLIACSPGEKAMEGKNGGRFTYELIKAAKSLSLHYTSPKKLIEHIQERMAEGSQIPQCIGRHKSQTIFNAVPFTPDAIYLPISIQENSALYVDAGLTHGILRGDQFSVHLHNYGGSHNPQIATVTVVEVYPTWSKCQLATQSKLRALSTENSYWARISDRRSRRPLHVHIKQKYAALVLRRKKSASVYSDTPVLPELLATPLPESSSDTLPTKVIVLSRDLKAADAARITLRVNLGFRNLLSPRFK